MTRITWTLDAESRASLHRAIDDAKDGCRVEILRPLRSTAQNRVMWPMLFDLSRQVQWYGYRLDPYEWKDVMTASLRNCRVVPTIEGDGLVPLGLHTSEMSDEEMSNLIELIQAFGAEHGVKWSAPAWLEEWAAEQRRQRKQNGG